MMFAKCKDVLCVVSHLEVVLKMYYEHHALTVVVVGGQLPCQPQPVRGVSLGAFGHVYTYAHNTLHTTATLHKCGIKKECAILQWFSIGCKL